jgi:hypothetical protein
MRSFWVRAVCVAFSFAVASCAARKEFADPRSIVVQDPMPGQALLYLIRAPHDSSTFSLRVGGVLAAVLPPEAYAALSLPPGQHIIQTYAGAVPRGGESTVPELKVAVEPNSRYFLVLSGRSERPGAAVQALAAVAGGPFTWFIPMSTGVVAGSHTWKPYTEEEARPMLSIATLAPQIK